MSHLGKSLHSSQLSSAPPPSGLQANIDEIRRRTATLQGSLLRESARSPPPFGRRSVAELSMRAEAADDVSTLRLQSRMRALERELDVADSANLELSALRSSTARAESENTRLRRRIDELEAALRRESKAQAESAERVHQLELASAAQSGSDRADRREADRARILQLSAESQKLTMDLLRCAEELKESQRSAEELSRGLGAARTEAAHLRTERDGLAATLAIAEADRDRASGRAASLAGRLEAAESEAAAVARELETERLERTDDAARAADAASDAAVRTAALQRELSIAHATLQVKALRAGEAPIWRAQYLQLADADPSVQAVVLQRLDAHDAELAAKAEQARRIERESDRGAKEAARSAAEAAELHRHLAMLMAAVERSLLAGAKEISELETALEIAGVGANAVRGADDLPEVRAAVNALSVDAAGRSGSGGGEGGGSADAFATSSLLERMRLHARDCELRLRAGRKGVRLLASKLKAQGELATALGAEVSTLTHQRAEAEARIEALASVHAALQLDVEPVATENGALSTALVELRVGLAAKTDEAAALASQLSAAVAARESSGAEAARLAVERDSAIRDSMLIKERFAEREAGHGELAAAYEAELVAARGDRVRLDAQIRELLAEVADLDALKSRYAASLQAAVERTATAEMEMEALAGEQGRAAEALRDAEGRAAQLAAQLAEAQAAVMRERVEAAAALEAARAVTVYPVQSMAESRAAQAEADRANEALRTANRQLAAVEGEARAALAAAEVATAKAAAAAAALAQSEARERKSADEAAESAAKASARSAEVKELERRLQESNLAAKHAQSELARAKERGEAAASRSDEAAGLRGELALQAHALRDREDRLRAEQVRGDGALAELETLRAAAVRRDAELGAREQAIAALQARLQAMGDSVTEAAVAASDRSHETERTAGSLAARERELSDARAALRETERERDALREACGLAEGRLRSTDARLSDVEQGLAAERESGRELMRLLQESEVAREMATRQLAEKADAFQRLASSADSRVAELETLLVRQDEAMRGSAVKQSAEDSRVAAAERAAEEARQTATELRGLLSAAQRREAETQEVLGELGRDHRASSERAAERARAREAELQAQVAAALASAGTAAADIENLQSLLGERDVVIRELEDEGGVARAAAAEWQARAEAAERAASERGLEVAGAAETGQWLNEVIAKRETRIAILENELTDLRDKLAARNAEAEADEAELTRAVAGVQARAEAMRSEYDTLLAAHSDAKAQLHARDREVAALQRRVARECERSHSAAGDAETSGLYATAAAEVDAATRRALAAEAESAWLRTALAAAEQDAGNSVSAAAAREADGRRRVEAALSAAVDAERSKLALLASKHEEVLTELAAARADAAAARTEAGREADAAARRSVGIESDRARLQRAEAELTRAQLAAEGAAMDRAGLERALAESTASEGAMREVIADLREHLGRVEAERGRLAARRGSELSMAEALRAEAESRGAAEAALLRVQEAQAAKLGRELVRLEGYARGARDSASPPPPTVPPLPALRGASKYDSELAVRRQEHERELEAMQADMDERRAHVEALKRRLGPL